MKIRLLTLLFLSTLLNPLYSQTINFSYTGAVQTWTVPPCVTSINVIVGDLSENAEYDAVAG